MPLKELSFGWQIKIVTVADQERRLEKELKGFGMLKIACVNGKNGKFLEVPYGKTVLQNITDDSSFQNFNFSYVERAKLQFAKMPLYGPSKLLDASKAVSKVTQTKISCKQPARF